MSTLFKRLKDLGSRILENVLPVHTKRLLFMVSLSTRIKETRELDVETIRKLNELLGLSSTPGAAQVPMMLNKVIWQDQSLNQIAVCLVSKERFPEKAVESFSQRILDCAPRWMRYDETSLRADLSKLIHHRQDVFGI